MHRGPPAAPGTVGNLAPVTSGEPTASGPGAAWPPPSPPAPSGPRTRADGGAWIAFGVAGFLVGQVAGLVVLVVVAAVTGHSHDYAQLAARPVPPGWVVVSELVGLWSGFVAAVVAASRLRGSGRVIEDIGLRFRWSDLLVGPVVGAAGQVGVSLLYLPFEHVVPHLEQKLSAPANHLTGGFPGSDLAVIAVLTVVVVPFVEESLFRGVFLRGLLRVLTPWSRGLGTALACVLSGLIFGLAHFEPLQLPGLALFGVVLAAMVVRTGRLGASILAHATFNLWAIVAVATVWH